MYLYLPNDQKYIWEKISDECLLCYFMDCVSKKENRKARTTNLPRKLKHDSQILFKLG